MTSIFWGLRLEPGKRYSTTVGRTFHVSMAALDCASVKNENEINCVMLQEGETDDPFILCNLQKSKNLQCSLDLNFLEGDLVTFFCKGNGTIHLSGYVHEDPDDLDLSQGGEEEEEEDLDDEENEDDDDDEEEDEDLKQALSEIGKKKKKANGLPASIAAKKMKLDVDDEDSEDEDDDEDSEEDDEDVDDEDEVEEEETPKKQQEKQKKPKNKEQNQQAAKANGLAAQPKLSKKEKKKAKQEAAAAVATGTSKPAEGSPNKQQAASEKKTLQGGVQIKDTTVGNGPVAKSGQKVQVYYVGRLKSNNKVFDQTKKGNGFAFHLGKGEVIKGWDVGVAGMKVGGKRTITCPANMAYGQKGSPPTIPPNSTLIFEVELRAVH